MKKNLLIHVSWAAIAVATFVIGSQRRSEDSPVEIGKQPKTKIADSTREPEGGPRISGARKEADKNSANLVRAGDRPQIPLEDLVTKATSDPSPLERQLAFGKLLERVTAENGEELLMAFKKNHLPSEQLELFLFVLGKQAGRGALELALIHTEVEGEHPAEAGENRAFLRSRMLAGWASTDPQAAIAWLRSHEEPDRSAAEFRGRQSSENLTQLLEDGLIRGLIAKDINLATDYLTEMANEGRGHQASRHISSIAHQQRDRLGFDAARSWGESLPDGEAKAAALVSIALNHAKTDPQAASAWAEGYAEHDWAADVVSRVAEDWAEEDSEASIAWLETLPHGEGRSRASFTAFREWVRRDSIAASSFILEMERSPARDNAVMALTQTIERSDGEAAVKWASEIEINEMRINAQIRAVSSWMKQDEAAAREWLGNSDLPQEVRDSIAP